MDSKLDREYDKNIVKKGGDAFDDGENRKLLIFSHELR